MGPRIQISHTGGRRRSFAGAHIGADELAAMPVINLLVEPFDSGFLQTDGPHFLKPRSFPLALVPSLVVESLLPLPFRSTCEPESDVIEKVLQPGSPCICPQLSYSKDTIVINGKRQVTSGRVDVLFRIVAVWISLALALVRCRQFSISTGDFLFDRKRQLLTVDRHNGREGFRSANNHRVSAMKKAADQAIKNSKHAIQLIVSDQHVQTLF